MRAPVILLAILAGCGGGGDPAPEPAPAQVIATAQVQAPAIEWTCATIEAPTQASTTICHAWQWETEDSFTILVKEL